MGMAKKEKDVFKAYFSHLTLDRLALTVNDGVRSNDAVGGGVCLNDLELHRSHATTHQEDVPFSDWPICLEEVWFQIHFKQVAVTKQSNAIKVCV
jgi:hypothetical protein